MRETRERADYDVLGLQAVFRLTYFSNAEERLRSYEESDGRHASSNHEGKQQGPLQVTNHSAPILESAKPWQRIVVETRSHFGEVRRKYELSRHRSNMNRDDGKCDGPFSGGGGPDDEGQGLAGHAVSRTMRPGGRPASPVLPAIRPRLNLSAARYRKRI